MSKVLVKSLATSKSGPPLFFKEEHYNMVNHPLIKNYIQTYKIRFQKFRRLEVVFDPETQVDEYFDRADKVPKFKGEMLNQKSSLALSTRSKSQSKTAEQTP